MSEEDDTTNDRTVVTTYVPKYQKVTWQEHADSLGMSQSEFVRTMVQAGRRGFGDETEPSTGSASSQPNPRGSNRPNGHTDELKSSVVDMLDTKTYKGWDDLIDGVIDDFEADLEETLIELEAENIISHSPRHGGYVLVED